MKLLTTISLVFAAFITHAVALPADLAFSLESRDTCSSPQGQNACGGGRECGNSAGVYTCSPSGQIVAIACCGPNGCKRINGEPFCV